MNRPLRLAECSLGVSWVNVYILRSVLWAFCGWMWTFHGVFVGCFVVECCVIGRLFAAFWQTTSSRRGLFIVPANIYSPRIRNLFEIHSMVFATCSLSVCYIFTIQKYGFCVAKVWFLSCKKGVFTLQKYGFCFLNVMLLQIGRNVFRGWVWILHEIDVDISQHIRCVLANRS